jgi:hypothetical protein
MQEYADVVLISTHTRTYAHLSQGSDLHSNWHAMYMKTVFFFFVLFRIVQYLFPLVS